MPLSVAYSTTPGIHMPFLTESLAKMLLPPQHHRRRRRLIHNMCLQCFALSIPRSHSSIYPELCVTVTCSYMNVLYRHRLLFLGPLCFAPEELAAFDVPEDAAFGSSPANIWEILQEWSELKPPLHFSNPTYPPMRSPLCNALCTPDIFAWRSLNSSMTSGSMFFCRQSSRQSPYRPPTGTKQESQSRCTGMKVEPITNERQMTM